MLDECVDAETKLKPTVDSVSFDDVILLQVVLKFPLNMQTFFFLCTPEVNPLKRFTSYFLTFDLFLSLPQCVHVYDWGH